MQPQTYRLGLIANFPCPRQAEVLSAPAVASFISTTPLGDAPALLPIDATRLTVDLTIIQSTLVYNGSC